MPDFLITYDLQDGSPDPHKPFLSAAQKQGLLYVWKGRSYVNRLPNTTLWGVFDADTDADAAFDRALAATEQSLGYKPILEKRATQEMGTGNVRSDKRKSPEPKWTGKSNFETSNLHQLHDPFFR